MSHILSIKKCKMLLTTDLMCMQLSMLIAKLDIYNEFSAKRRLNLQNLVIRNRTL